MAISKIILNGVTQIDLTSDTVAASNLISPNTAHGADGEPVVGTATQGITPTGTKNISITQNGTTTEDVTNYASAQITVNVPTGSTKNVQYYMGADYARAASYTATDVTLTVTKTGTYKVSWMAWRSTSSGTSGSQLYINGNAYGSANETFTSTYGQAITLSGVSLTQGDVLVVRARARGTNYYMYVGNLIIEEQ